MDYSSTLFIKRKKESGQTYPNEDKDENRDKVVSSGDRVFIRQAEEVHDGGTHAQYALDLVSRRLVCIDGPDLGLSGGPRGLLQVHLQSEDKKKKNSSSDLFRLSQRMRSNESLCSGYDEGREKKDTTSGT